MSRRVWIGWIILGCCLAVVSVGCRKKAPESPKPEPIRTSSPEGNKPVESAPSSSSSAPEETSTQTVTTTSDKPSIVIVPENKEIPAVAVVTAPGVPDLPKQTDPVVIEKKPEKPLPIADDAWTQDFDGAVQKAIAENKDLLINFTGSDWCPWCIRLDDEVFGKEEFKKAAGKSFVLVKIDFPRDLAKAGLTEAMQARNQKLQERYGIQGYPTILLTDGHGRPYAQTAYKEGGQEKYLEHLTTLQQAGRTIRKDLIAAGKGDLPPMDRAKLLDQALSQLPTDVMTEFYREEIDKIIELDPQNQAGLKNKYLLIREFKTIQAALDGKKYAQAKDIIDAAILKLNPTGPDAQNLYFARAHAVHYLNDAAGEKDSLQKALDAAPNTESAVQIRRLLEIYFPKPPALARAGKIETNLKTYQNFQPERAFDGNPDSFFWAAGDVSVGDQVTLTLEQPTALQEIRILTGSEQVQQGRLYEGAVEVSEDGQEFKMVGEFREGIGFAKLNGQTVKAVRIRCTKNQTEWLVVREIELK
ncbi:MAG: thioredoxin fold domain-containing protein [Phycisphaerae bacterium]|nr:thioredoxin fold domain-containing protein [Phycisphaerae bacterium]